jgi:hypothetical protein
MPSRLSPFAIPDLPAVEVLAEDPRHHVRGVRVEIQHP